MSDFTFTQAIVIGSAAAIVTAVSGLLVARWRNRHELRLKELDSQQKRTDFQFSIDLDTQKRKALAAEVIVKQWSLVLSRIELQERFYQKIAKNGYNKNMFPLAQQYEVDMASITKRMEAEGKDVSDLVDLYFGNDPTIAEAVTAEIAERDLSQDRVVLQHELKGLVIKSIALMGKQATTEHPITRMALGGASKAIERAVLLKVRQILEHLEADGWILRRAIAIIRKELNYPEIK